MRIRVERTVTNGGSVGEVFLVPCVRCDNMTNHEVVASVDIKEQVDDGDITEWTTYQIVRCRGCETYSFRRSNTSTEDYVQDYYGGGHLAEDVGIYPPRMVGRRRLRGLLYLPPNVKRIYNETHAALSSNLPMLAGVGIRSLVEAVCQEKEAKGGNLKRKIEDLVTQSYLTPSGAETLQKLRLMGNEAVHEMKRHDTQTLGNALDVVEHLLLGVYILPEESERLSQ